MRNLGRNWRRTQRVIPLPERPVAVVVESPAGLGVASVGDISEGGMELVLAEPCEPGLLGQVLRLRLTLADHGEFAVAGQVRHLDGERLGVAFQGMAEPYREALRAYVEQAAASLWQRLRRMIAGPRAGI